MTKILFELTNEQRRCLGIVPVEPHWELVEFEDMYLYYDGDIIRKNIYVGNDHYLEAELREHTAENRTILLPKTNRGKPKKMNYTATQSFSPFGVYLRFGEEFLSIANYTTQTTFYRERFSSNKNIEDLRTWLEQWVADTTDNDLQEIEAYKTAKRQHFKFKEGDFFAFKIGRRHWGFGRILIDLGKLRKTEEFKKQKNIGLASIMCKPLIVKLYHKISDTLDIDLDELKKCSALPSAAIMDNEFYYGENKIIGHRDLAIDEYDMLISYGTNFRHLGKDAVYLQYGLIYKETSIKKFSKYLEVTKPDGHKFETPYENIGVGFGIDTYKFEECVESQSNDPFWNRGYFDSDYDLRNPKNADIKKEIFRAFGLDADKSYEENLKLQNF